MRESRTLGPFERRWEGGVDVAELRPLAGTAADGDDMTLAVLRDDAGVTVVVEGEIDLMTVSRLSDMLSVELAKAPPVLVLDLDGVGFLASMGITALALAEREAAEKGTALRVVASGRSTLRPLEITGMTEQLAVYASRQAALGVADPSCRPQQGM